MVHGRPAKESKRRRRRKELGGHLDRRDQKEKPGWGRREESIDISSRGGDLLARTFPLPERRKGNPPFLRKRKPFRALREGILAMGECPQRKEGRERGDGVMFQAKKGGAFQDEKRVAQRGWSERKVRHRGKGGNLKSMKLVNLNGGHRGRGKEKVYPGLD